MSEAGASLAALVRAAAAAAPRRAGRRRRRGAADLGGARRRRRPGRRRVRRAAASRPVTGSPSSCPTASPGCAPPSARCAPAWSSSRSTPPTPTPSSSTCSPTPGAALLVAAADRAAGRRRPRLRRAARRRRPAAGGRRGPRGAGVPRLHQRHDRSAPRRDPHRRPRCGPTRSSAWRMTPPPVRADDRVLLVLPLFHVYGLNAGFGLVAATGACAVLQETFDPRGSLALMAEEQVTAVPGAPPMYQAWLAAADAARQRRRAAPRASPRCGMASSGAAPLPEEIWTAMRDRAAVTVWEGYGLTEAVAGGRQHPGHRPGQAELHRRPAARRRARSCGTPPTTELRRRATADATSDHLREAPARSGCAAPTSSPATGPTARTARTPTAGWAPATSPTATPTATCTSSTGAAT